MNSMNLTTSLKTLICFYTNISSLDFSGANFAALRTVDCHNNLNLTTLTLSNVNLNSLDCSNTNITYLDVTSSTDLITLTCKNCTKLRSTKSGVDYLDLTQIPDISTLTSFNSTGSSNLAIIKGKGPQPAAWILEKDTQYEDITKP